MFDPDVFRGCQLCTVPCFRFFEEVGVCPDEIGLATQEQRETYLNWVEENPIFIENNTASLLDSDDCCPHLEKVTP